MLNSSLFDVRTLVSLVWRDFRQSRRPLVVFSFVFELAKVWLIAPVVALGLAAVLSFAGHIAVSNKDVLDFFLTPGGALFAFWALCVTVCLQFFEQAGIMSLVTLIGSGEPRGVAGILAAAFPRPARVAKLGLMKLAVISVVLLPFVLVLWGIYKGFLSRQDINYYLAGRPPEFWIAVVAGSLTLLGALFVCAFLLVRWSFALPIILFENVSPVAALGMSQERVRGAFWRVGACLIGWMLGSIIFGYLLESGFRMVASYLLGTAGEKPIGLLLALLILQGGILATWSFITVVGLALVTKRLNDMRKAQLGIGQAEIPTGGAPNREEFGNQKWRLNLVLLPIMIVAPITLWANLGRYSAGGPPVMVTAHRGHSRGALENTLSAICKAIESGADFAEIDVALTADGVVVLLHDRDLKRVAGDPRRVDEISFEEICKLDVGSWFGADFRGERVPTLSEVIQLAKGKIKLNIELKFYGSEKRLTREVAQLIDDLNFENDCIVTTFNYEAVVDLKHYNSGIRAGLIIAHALGDVSRLDLEVLSVRADWLTDQVLHQAHRRGREVHVWTVNSPVEMARLIKRGVDNIITDDPDELVRVRNEWNSLTETERILLASRMLLGLEP